MFSFKSLQRLSYLLAAHGKPWLIAGGWAIDLFLDKVTREHNDIDIAVLRKDQQELKKSLKGWKFFKVTQPELKTEVWPDNEWLELPVHEIHAVSPEDNFRLEFVLNESDDTDWIFRRDPRITLPLAELGLVSNESWPYLNPAVVLLYKAKNPKPVDEQDFQNVSPALSLNHKQWLKKALNTCHPGHHWQNSL
jgi:hypothetical protein